MSMLHGVLRAATAALLLVIAVLVYINYFRSAETDATNLRTELSTPPELPRLAAGPEALPPAAAPEPAATSMAAEAVRAAQGAVLAVSRENTGAPRQPRAELIEDNVLAEVVELPPVKNPHASGLPFPAAQQPAPKAPNAAAPAKRTHVVQPGESLWLISKRLYGNAELYSKIADANGLNAKDRVRVGQVLVIPDQNAPAENFAPKTIAEDFADHEDTPRTTSVSHEGPASMSSTVKIK